MSSEKTYGKGPNFRDLGNAVSDAINAALKRGMEIDEACCVVVSVAADYARLEYGNDYLPDLAEVVSERKNHALPELTQ